MTDDQLESVDAISTLSTPQRVIVLVAAFLGWMFAGLEMSNFNQITGSATAEFLGDSLSAAELKVVTGKWFAWFICSFLMGAAGGGLLFGWLGDRFGRVKAMGASILCYSLIIGAGYWATSLEQLLILRFIACFGIGGMWPNGIALVSEAWSNASRPLLAGLIGTAANIGIAMLGFMAAYWGVDAENWRWILQVSAAPAVLGVLVLVLVPESPRWLATRHAHREKRHGSSVGQVFRPPYLKLTIIGILLGTIPLLGGWGTNNWLIQWAGNVGKEIGDASLKGATQGWGSTGAAIGSLFGGWLADRFGRRSTYFAVSLGSLFLSGFIFWFLTPAVWFFVPAVFVLRLVSTVYFGWLPLYLPELFPTEVRSTGSGVTFNFGRILTTAGVLFIGGVLVTAFNGDLGKVGRITHLIYVLGMVVILFAPDTSGKHLE